MPNKPTRKPMAEVTTSRGGVAALFQNTSLPGTKLEGARNIPLELIDNNPDQPRQKFNEKTLSRLTASIREHGVLEPIIVRAVDERFVIIAGEQRRRAAQAAGLDTIPAIVRTDIEDAQASTWALVENLQRGDVPPGDTARAVDRLQKQTGWGVREIARQLGRSRQWASYNIALVRRMPDLLEQVEAGTISVLQAVKAMQEQAQQDQEVSNDLTPCTVRKPHLISREALGYGVLRGCRAGRHVPCCVRNHVLLHHCPVVLVTARLLHCSPPH